MRNEYQDLNNNFKRHLMELLEDETHVISTHTHSTETFITKMKSVSNLLGYNPQDEELYKLKLNQNSLTDKYYIIATGEMVDETDTDNLLRFMVFSPEYDKQSTAIKVYYNAMEVLGRE